MGRDIIDLCIGLDVGTSTTKVVIHPLYSNDDSFFVVDFGESKTIDATYLLPTKLALNENTKQFELPCYKREESSFEELNFIKKMVNKFSRDNIDKKPHKQKIFENLKVNFMNQEENATEYLRVFIALVIQYTKNWFVSEYGDRDFMKNKNIIWSINMGIPSAKFSADGENKKYLTLLKTAYNLSKQPVINELNYKNINNEELDIEHSIIPEIVATVSSFVTQEDVAAQALYCAIDIGAGTTDICTFRIHRDVTDRYSFFKSSVLELGADRYNEVKNKDAITQSFLEQLGKVIWPTKTYRDPKAEEWTSYLPLVLCGGGSYIDAYKNVIADYEQNPMIQQLGWRGFRGYRYIQLPGAQYIYVSMKIDPKRLLVARGLSLSSDFYTDIKKYYAETEIEDIEITRRPAVEFISKAMC